MRLSTYLRWMARESRGSRGRMIYFAACLAVGVAAVVGTGALSKSIEDGYRAKSREILGADFTVDARRPLPPELDAAIGNLPGARRSDLLETASMVTVPGVAGSSRIALVFAVSGRYPLYGEIETDPPGGLGLHLDADTVVAAGELLSSLGLSPGAELQVGGRVFRVAAAVTKEPERLGFSSFLGPTIYLSREGFERTGLLTFGAQVQYRALVALPDALSSAELDEEIARIEAEVPGAAYLDFDTHFDVGPQGRRSTRRIEGFVGLVALLSLVVGGIGVSQIVRAWLAGRTPAIAVMRCLGVRPGQILLLSLGHTALLALVGSVVGAAAGCTLPFAVRATAPELFPGGAITIFPVAAILRGLGLGVGLALAFALPPLTAIWRVPPARVLRADAEPLPPRLVATASASGLLLVGVFGAAWVQSGQVSAAAWFSGGFVGLTTALFLGAKLLMFAAGHVPRGRLNPYLRHGIASLARPGAGTTGAVVALGLGTMVVTAMWLVETRLREGILGQVPPDAPSVFLMDIQPEEWDGVFSSLARAKARAVDQVPVVTARISAIDGRPIDEIAAEAEAGGWSRRAVTREQRLTWREELPPDNEITEGALWSDPDRAEVSIEERFAGRLGVGVGSEIELDVRGVPVKLSVTSLRSVEWQSFSINFFLVVEPGVLDLSAALYLASARLPAEEEQGFQDRLATAHPGVTVLRVRTLLDQVLALLGRIASGIRLLGSFTVAAGLAILAGAVSATALRRGGEVALLKTLGVTRAGVTALFLVEYGLCGLVAGAVGAGGALLLAFGYLEYVAELPVSLPFLALPVAALGCAALTALCGLAASARALTTRPIHALR